MALAISRREMFKQAVNKRSLQLLGFLLPGGLERILGIGSINTHGSAEEAGLALGRRRRNEPSKLMLNTSRKKSDETKLEISEEFAQGNRGDS